MSNKPLFISEEIAQYLKAKYEVDISSDDRLSCKPYNPHICLGRCWYGLPEYVSYAGGLHNYQCQHTRTEGSHFCQAHTIQYYSSGLPFGRIDQPPPESPCKIIDLDGNIQNYYWLKDSEGMKRDEIFLKEEAEKQEKYQARRGRGRPPTKKILYKEIDWNNLYEEDKIDTLPLNTLKEFLQKNNLNLYGRKAEIVKRINEFFERVD